MEQNKEIPKKFIIDRSTWRCGGHSNKNTIGLGDTNLLNSEGFMCCLGQIAEQLGVPRMDMKFLGYPSDVGRKIPFLNEEGEIDFGDGTSEPTTINTPLSHVAMMINDDSNLTLEEIEKELQELFNKHGLEL